MRLRSLSREQRLAVDKYYPSNTPLPPADKEKIAKHLMENGLFSAEQVEILMKTTEEDAQYAMGGRFKPNRELKKTNLSPEAYQFIQCSPIARRVLAELHDYDGYSYIHTVQMLNLTCRILTDQFDALKSVLKTEGSRFAVDDETLKNILKEAVVCHDWGKTEISRQLLNKGRLEDEKERHELERHALETARKLAREIGRGKGLSHNDIEKILKKAHNEDRRKVLTAYLAASHHKGASKVDKGRDYPADSEIEAHLPHYRDWLDEGREQIAVMVMIDVMDAMRSERSYKSPADPGRAKEVVGLEVSLKDMEEDKKKQYIELISFVSDFWEQMSESAKYSEKRRELKPNNAND